MSSKDNRRKGVRLITGIPVILRSAQDGSSLDERATAHDVSELGFRLETQAELAQDAMIAFTMDLAEGGRVSGRGLVVWCKRETYASWAGVKLVEMRREDRRRLSRMMNPAAVDWERISALAIKALFAATVVAAAHKLVFRRPHALSALAQLAPKAIALLLMAWALRGLLRSNRR